MKTTMEYINSLNDLDIKLWAEDGKLFYNAPEGAIDTKLRNELTSRKQDILAFFENLNNKSKPDVTPIIKRELDKNIPLSFAQERLWIIDKLIPESPIYLVPIALRMKVNLDFIAMRKALMEIVRRHEVLRTRFKTIDGKPTQVIDHEFSFLPSLVDLQGLPEPVRETESRRILIEESLLPFDLEKDLLIRTKLVVMDRADYVFLVTMHHIASDAWSLGIFQKEVMQLYHAFSMGKASPLPDLSIQYADFAAWQREWFSGDVLEDQMSYWEDQLSDLKPLELPIDRIRPAVPTNKGNILSFVVKKEISDKLKSLGNEKDVTLYMTLLAVFSIILSRYSGQKDIAVSSAIANRNRSEIEELIGFFVNTQVMRTDLSGNPTFLELLDRVKKTALDAYANQDMPFEQIVDRLQPERDMSRNPLVQVAFTVQNAFKSNFEMSDLDLIVIDAYLQTVRFDMEVTLEECLDGIKGQVVYSTDLFEEATISGMIERFTNLLNEITNDPARRISEIPMLSSEATDQLLIGWNSTEIEYDREICIPEIFENQVIQTPDALAVVYEDHWISYGELNKRANQVAGYLRSLGVGPEALVGVYMDRSPDTVIGIMGILKAGGAYVPLDPFYPRERLAFMLSDSGAPVILTKNNYLETLPADINSRVICIDTDWDLIKENGIENPPVQIDPKNLAYVIYTSGSTGTPKGVMISHSGLVNYITWASGYYDISSGQGSPVHSSFSFDLTVTGFYLPLLAGRPLTLVREERSGEALCDILENQRDFSLVKLTPAHLELLGRILPSEKASGRTRRLIIGGEALDYETLTFWREHAPETRLINEYGPTETVVGCCVYEVDAKDTVTGAVPIGRPVANTQLYVLNHHYQPSPVGIPGELYIGGDCICRGYINRPDLTVERYIPDFNSGREGKWLYRTGDSVKYRSDGNLEFVGRVDDQVKIRGYRIELGEIESVLTEHPDVREGVVTALDRDAGDKRLVAYIVPSHEDSYDASEIRDYLDNRLPEYMIPSAFMALDELPLTANGKVDRKNLPDPDKSGLEGEYVAPRNETEEKLVEIWSEVLDLDRIGVHDNFFEIGGNSLLATQVVSRILEVFSVNLPVRVMFESKNIAELSLKIEEARMEEDSVSPIEPVSRDEDLPLSFAQERLWFIDQLVPDNPMYNVPVAIRMQQNIDASLLSHVFTEIVRRHEVLRTRFGIKEGKPIQIIDQEIKAIPSVIDLQHLSGQVKEAEALRIAAEESLITFDLENDLMLRVKLVVMGEADKILLLTMHHIVSDGWSMGILQKELTELFTALSKGEPSPLPDLPIQYADFAVWQRKWLSGEVLDRQLSYWKEQLAEITSLDIPMDYKRTDIHSYRGDILPVHIDNEIVNKLKEISLEKDVSLYMVLLGAFSILLSRYSSQEDIAVASFIANRNRKEIEGLIGFFVNTLIMRNNLTGDPTFLELLDRVSEMALDAYSNQDLPFEQLVDELQPERDMSKNPFAQIAFSFQNAHRSGAGLSDFKQIGSGLQTVRFDLEAIFWETAEDLEGSIVYNTNLFCYDTISRIIKQFSNLVKEISQDPTRRISEIPILSEKEADQLLVEWNDTETEYPEDKTIYELFEEQVEMTPESIAVIFEDTQISYQELNNRSNQLAHYLRKKGVGAGSVVAIMYEQNIDIVIAILGILKAGAAYLPIDIRNPIDRILSMLNNGRIDTLLTHSHIKKIPFSTLQNLKYIEEDIFVTPKRQQILDLDTLPMPDRSLVDYNKYDQYIGEGCVMKSISILATRGCPYSCLYCHKIWPKRHVFRSAQNIFDEIKYHYEVNGYQTFSILDDIFNLNRKNSEEFFNRVIKDDMKIRLIFPNGLRGDILTPGYIDMMSEAGVIQMALALETASPRLQKLVGKNLNIENLHENLEYICKHHPHIIIDLFFMLGFPTETEEEALMTLDYVSGIKWLHFPTLSFLKIFPNTEMAKLAMKHGVSQYQIERSSNSAFHNTDEALHFSESFSKTYKAKYMNEYFLNQERLNYVIPLQKKVLNRDEIIAKYNNYLPGKLENYKEILELIGDDDDFYSEDVKDNKKDIITLSGIDSKKKEVNDDEYNTDNKLDILLLDLSQNLDDDDNDVITNMVEAPLGLMYLMTFLNREFGKKINGKIAKSMIDFKDYSELRRLINDFHPKIIGIRTLSLYKTFFHEVVSQIKSWFPDITVIAGGPYATSEYSTILADSNIDIVVRGEGEITFSELIGRIIENNGNKPDDEELEKIPGLAFVPENKKEKLKRMGIGRDIILYDHAEKDIAQEKSTNLSKINHPDELAYVIYTSGSTGTPKGVMITHRGLVNYSTWASKAYDISSGYGSPVHSSFSFDLTVTGFYLPLLAGRSVVIVKEDRTGESLRDILVNNNDFSVVKLTPAHLELLGHILPHENASGRTRRLVIGGEILKQSTLSFWKEHAPETKLINEYGPTETVVGCCAYEVNIDDTDSGSVPIGRPISNTNLYVLDHHLKPSPVGVPGELYIGGDGIGRGYMNRPDLTVERYIPDSFSGRLGTCLYRTGDLVSYRSDGNLEFIGRVDEQVNLRGYRIELGEIESVLMDHPAVRDCVVISCEKDSRDNRLVAYIVPSEEDLYETAKIKKYLSDKLPDYMTPSTFVELDEIPLTINGKVDRSNLPDPDKNSLEEEYAPPRNDMEAKLVEIWSEVLGLDKIGIHDNFFEIGGDSILSILVVRTAKKHGLEITPKQIFQNQTIYELADVVNVAPSVQAEQGVVTGTAPLTPVQHWFFDMGLIEEHYYNQSLMFEVPFDIDSEILRQSICELTTHHDALRMRFNKETSGWKQTFGDIETEVPFIEINLEEIPSGDQKNIFNNMVNHLQASLNLSDGPIFRLGLFKLSPERPAYLLFIIHHLVVDWVSWRVLLEDIHTAYEQLSQGAEISLMSKTTSLKQWAERLTEYTQTEKANSELGYWLNETWENIFDLPTDYPSEKYLNTVASMESVEISLNESLTDKLLHEVHQAYNTHINDILLAALAKTISDWTGEMSLLLNLEGHGREDLFDNIDLTRTVGWFSSVYPVHLNLPDTFNVGELLKSTKEQMRSIPNNGIGYGLLRYLHENIRIREKFNELPQAQVSYNYLGQMDTVNNENLLFSPSKEYSGNNAGAGNIRFHLLDFNGMVVNGRLVFNIFYSRNIYKNETIENLGNAFMGNLELFIEHCLNPEVGGFTPSDFPLAGIDQNTLDNLFDI